MNASGDVERESYSLSEIKRYMEVSRVRLCVSASESPYNWPDSNYSERKIYHISNNSLASFYTNSWSLCGHVILRAMLAVA